MKVTFEIELPDVLVENLDYYENYGVMNDPLAGCKKCIFHDMCGVFTTTVGNVLSWDSLDCKFPCWNTRRDRIAGTNRRVFVPKTESNKI